MRKLIVLGIMFLFTSLAFAETDRIDVETITAATESVLIAVPTTTTVYTKSFSVKQTGSLAICDKLESNSANLKITLQQSFDRPTTEGSSDIKYINTYSDIPIRQSTSKWEIATIDTMTSLPFARFKLQGLSGNDDTRIQLKVGKQ